MPDTNSKRCLDCGYILDRLPRPRCPECGREFDPGEPWTYAPAEAPTGWPQFLTAIVGGIVFLGALTCLKALDRRVPPVADWIFSIFRLLLAGAVLAAIGTVAASLIGLRRPAKYVARRRLALALTISLLLLGCGFLALVSG